MWIGRLLLLLVLWALTRAVPACAGQRAAQPGVFDYYVLNLSWSPEFCYSNARNPECALDKHFGFIVHGLWPQFRQGGGPEYCGQQPGPTNLSGLLDIMPDPHLVAHEWQAHGSCSGLPANDYFGLVRQTFAALHIPAQFVRPTRQFNIRPADLKAAFVKANPGLPVSALALTCTGPYLKAIEVCLTKTGKPTACGSLRDCRIPTLRVPKVH
jgi:ribonuclease T2